jgi:DNA replication and repair protein RecF
MTRSALAAGSGSDEVVHAAADPGLWIGRVILTNFRNYRAAELNAGPGPVVLLGSNGAGKTNLLEAVSLLSPGHGLRRARFDEIARQGSSGGWIVAADVTTPVAPVQIGTGFDPDRAGVTARAGRVVRIDGRQAGPSALAEHAEMVWLTPAMDGLFTGPASERRRFLDRLILCFDTGFATLANRYERAMRQRNRLLADGVRDPARFEGLEILMAETGIALAAARVEAVVQLAATIAVRRDADPSSPFPWAQIALDGEYEAALLDRPAVDVEDHFRRTLADDRERDRAAGRALHGPHRSDLIVEHGPKAIAARFSSTGEQKALLVGLILAHAELLRRNGDRAAPILLLDEVAAHLDQHRRAALFADILRLGAQAWMTGTDELPFEALAGRARFLRVDDGRVTPF